MKQDINDGLCSFGSKTVGYAEGGQRFVDSLKEIVGGLGMTEIRLESVLNQGLADVAIQELEQGQDMQMSQDRFSRA